MNHLPALIRRLAIIWLIGATLIAAACGSSPSSPSNQPIRRVVVLGDSLAVTPTIAQSFPSALQDGNAAAVRVGLRGRLSRRVRTRLAALHAPARAVPSRGRRARSRVQRPGPRPPERGRRAADCGQRLAVPRTAPAVITEPRV